jgi:hypothetical protein
MKLAALSLIREKKNICIKTGGETWKFSIKYEEIYEINMLFVEIK